MYRDRKQVVDNFIEKAYMKKLDTETTAKERIKEKEQSKW